MSYRANFKMILKNSTHFHLATINLFQLATQEEETGFFRYPSLNREKKNSMKSYSFKNIKQKDMAKKLASKTDLRSFSGVMYSSASKKKKNK